MQVWFSCWHGGRTQSRTAKYWSSSIWRCFNTGYGTAEGLRSMTGALAKSSSVSRNGVSPFSTAEFWQLQNRLLPELLTRYNSMPVIWYSMEKVVIKGLSAAIYMPKGQKWHVWCFTAIVGVCYDFYRHAIPIWKTATLCSWRRWSISVPSCQPWENWGIKELKESVLICAGVVREGTPKTSYVTL